MRADDEEGVDDGFVVEGFVGCDEGFDDGEVDVWGGLLTKCLSGFTLNTRTTEDSITNCSHVNAVSIFNC